MKLKRLSIYAVLIIVALSLTILPGKANATVSVASAQIVRVGAQGGVPDIMVRLVTGVPAYHRGVVL